MKKDKFFKVFTNFANNRTAGVMNHGPLAHYYAPNSARTCQCFWQAFQLIRIPVLEFVGIIIIIIRICKESSFGVQSSSLVIVEVFELNIRFIYYLLLYSLKSFIIFILPLFVNQLSQVQIFYQSRQAIIRFVQEQDQKEIILI